MLTIPFAVLLYLYFALHKFAVLTGPVIDPAAL